MNSSSTRRRFWTAAATHWDEEERAAHHVERLGFEFYLPRYSTIGTHERGRRAGQDYDRRELLFPGYIMIKISDGWERLTRTRGIMHLFTMNEVPVRMRTSDIQRLRDAEDENGLVRLTPHLVVGQEVMIGEGGGAFVGKIGIVEDTSVLSQIRVQFENMLGRRATGKFDERVLFAT